MKNIKNILTAAFLGGALLLPSCNDWLDLDPENSVTANKYWQTEADVSAALTGIYCSMLSNTGNMITHGEIRADFWAEGRKSDGNYLNVRRGNITSTNGYANWASYYTVINNCNLLLEMADKALANDPSFKSSACEKYKAQARVIRAYMYFYLIRTHKDVPYVTWAYFDDTTERDCAPSSQMDILNDLIRELEEVQSANVLDYTYSITNVAENKGKVTMYTLKAILADMYRWKGALETNAASAVQAYERCVTLCEEIIASGQFALLAVPKEDAATAAGSMLEDAQTAADSAFYVINYDAANEMFTELFVEGNSVESIFELQVDNYGITNFFNLFVTSSYPFAANESHLQFEIFLPTENEIAASADYADVRQRLNCQAGQVWKFAGADLYGTTYANTADYERNVVMYRLAEIYLMEAEALNQLAWSRQADRDSLYYDYLARAYKCAWIVRDRSCAVEATDVFTSSGDYMQVHFWKQLQAGEPLVLDAETAPDCKSMEKFIMEEQGRELMYEGRRWFDILRHAARNEYGKGALWGGSIDYLLNITLYAATVDKVDYVRKALKNNYESHYWPYPYNDVKYNNLLTQKPFYGVE